MALVPPQEQREARSGPDNATLRDSESDRTMITSPPVKEEELPQEHKAITAFNALSRIYSASPLPGSAAPLPEYRNIMAQIDQQYIIRADYNAKLLSYEAQDKQLVKAIADLPAEEERSKQTIRQSYAAGIQKDMEMQFKSDEELHLALERRRVEAAQAREKLACDLDEKKEEDEVARGTIARMKSEIQMQIEQVEENLLPLVAQKNELERRGGAAMMFALCQEIVGEGE